MHRVDPVAALRATAWLVIAALVAFGAAGIVAAMDHVPGTPARPELTWSGDARVRPALDAAADRLAELTEAVAGLGSDARLALTHVISRDIAGLEQALAGGSARLSRVEQLAVRLRAEVAAVPGLGPGSVPWVSTAIRDRHAALEGAVGLTDALPVAWASLDARALSAARVAATLNRHDEETAAAALAGSEGRYADALAQLDASDATIARLRTLADELEDSTDVRLLTDWVDRNAAYDAALRSLWTTVIEARGRETPAVRSALSAEREARARLPEDNRALTVIMSDIAQGGANQAVVRIEEARARLQAAIAAQQNAADAGG